MTGGTGSFPKDLWLWLANTPPEPVMAHLRIDKVTFDAIQRDKIVIMPG